MLGNRSEEIIKGLGVNLSSESVDWCFHSTEMERGCKDFQSERIPLSAGDVEGCVFLHLTAETKLTFGINQMFYFL